MKKHRCRVCAGAGHWLRATGDPVYSTLVFDPKTTTRCMVCKGTGFSDLGTNIPSGFR